MNRHKWSHTHLNYNRRITSAWLLLSFIWGSASGAVSSRCRGSTSVYLTSLRFCPVTARGWTTRWPVYKIKNRASDQFNNYTKYTFLIYKWLTECVIYYYIYWCIYLNRKRRLIGVIFSSIDNSKWYPTQSNSDWILNILGKILFTILLLWFYRFGFPLLCFSTASRWFLKKIKHLNYQEVRFSLF